MDGSSLLWSFTGRRLGTPDAGAGAVHPINVLSALMRAEPERAVVA
jgi:hypothetical protein